MSVTDSPVQAPQFPGPTKIDQAKTFIGDLARPFALISISGACAWGLLQVVVTPDKLGLALGAVAAMYGAKAWETRAATKAGADVEVAKATAGASS